MSRLATLSEEPINEDDTENKNKGLLSKKGHGHYQHSWKNWLKSHLSLAFILHKKSDVDDDLKILLSVLACPLFPLPLRPQLPLNQVSSSAQYIIQHFTAATGCRKLEGRVKNIFITGKLTMAMVDDLASVGGAVAQKGCFVMWQMIPNNWLIQLVVAGQKVVAGSDGNVAWRHTPWIGSHSAKGAVRPLRRALQGLDPMAIAAVFSPAQYMGEKCIRGIDCFVLKLSADQAELAERSDSSAEMIKHVIFGYFSQRNGLLVYLEDSCLTRIQSLGTYPTYWETTITTKIEDYKLVEGVMIAHGGQSCAIITRFGENLKAGLLVTRMEETWTIDDLAFNVPGLSTDCFIPPKEIEKRFPDENNLDWRLPLC